MQALSDPQPFAMRAVASDVLLRAFAILLVVFNHAGALPGRMWEPGGGMNILVLLSGMAFAQYTLTKPDMPAMRQSTLRFGWNIALPCLGVILFSFVLRGETNWRELLFINQFFQMETVAVMYSWYPEALLQILGLFLLASFIPGMGTFLRSRPLLASVAALGFSFAVFLVMRRVWYPPHLDAGTLGWLFYFVMWQFALGWLVYFAMSSAHALGVRAKAGVLALATGLAFIAYDPSTDHFRMVVMLGSLATVLFVPTVKVPALIARPAVLISQATFTIFLLHVIFFRIFEDLGLRTSTTDYLFGDAVFAWLFAVAGCFVTWLGMTAVRRAWRRSLMEEQMGARTYAPA